jgi:hypothetical protein
VGGRFELHCVNHGVEIVIGGLANGCFLHTKQLDSVVIVGKLVYDLHTVVYMRRIDVSECMRPVIG